MRIITKTVWTLSVISLFTDMASEMLYPVMPVYLKSIGFSVWMIGILEGLAEAITGLSKSYFGKWSDVTGRRVPFVRVGYALSSISKPMMAVFTYPLWIVLSRSVDRLGKGIRSAARDAMLSDEATVQTKGSIFGFHRSMDTLGAAIGPVIALVYLHYYPANYIHLFYLAFIPGFLSIVTGFWLKESAGTSGTQKKTVSFGVFIPYWRSAPAQYKKVTLGLWMFTLINSSDLFLLLMVKEAGFGDAYVIGAYIFYNLIYALFAWPAGRIADRIGLKTTLITGIFLFALVYFGMALFSELYLIFLLFFIYGLYAAASEGISKAWISNLCRKEDTATAMGTFFGIQSIFALPASAITGLVWYHSGAAAAFIATASAAVLVAVYFIRLPGENGLKDS